MMQSMPWDPVYAKNIGVDIDELYISQPDSGDQALEITETMVRSGGHGYCGHRLCGSAGSQAGDRGEIWETAMWDCRQD